MAKHPTPDDIMRDLLALSSPVEAQQAAPRVETAPPTPEASQKPARERRRVFETPTRQVHREWGKREQQREARARAEEWWQALRRWKIEPGAEITVYTGNPKPSGMRLVGTAQGSGVPSSYTTNVEMVTLPCGLREAAAVGRQMLARPPLAELYRGAGLATLIHSSGRGWATQRAKECGLAVLELADTLEQIG